MFFVGYILFSEMASQKWIAMFAFLALFTFKMEVTGIRRLFFCRKQVTREFKETITAVKDCNCSGKSPDCLSIAYRGEWF